MSILMVSVVSGSFGLVVGGIAGGRVGFLALRVAARAIDRERRSLHSVGEDSDVWIAV